MNDEPKSLNILFMASEAAPLVKVGGLGDVAGSLPLALRRLKKPDMSGRPLDVRLVLPFHNAIKDKIPNPQVAAEFKLVVPHGEMLVVVYLTHVADLPVYLIDGPPIAPDNRVYAADPLLDGEKYVFFSLAALEMTRCLIWKADIIHANDWHTSAALYALAQKRKHDPAFQTMHSLLSVHNLPFMGKDAEPAAASYGLPRSREKNLPTWARQFPLPLGLQSADLINAVSPGYAKEILTPEFGCGLQDFLNTRQGALSGILNGLDQADWDPATDTTIVSRYDHTQLALKHANKTALQTEFELPVNPEVPLLVMVTRMDQQKGVDIAVDGLRLAADLDWQAIILGTGDPLLETRCRSLESEFPDRVRALIRFDIGLSRRMYAGGDVLLMPSRYEPCGLAQMIAMRYGTVPLARATGGLRDTIDDDPTLASSTGFLFEDARPEAFAETLRRAIYAYPDREIWSEIQVRGMKQDFSWEKSALEYAKLYYKLAGR